MRHLTYVFVAILACASVTAEVPAQTPSADAEVYGVAYVDVMASGRATMIAALKQYRDASRGEDGFVRIDLFEQVGRPAHFSIVETWRDQKAFDAHAVGGPSKQLQQAMQPIRLSGYDQRPYKALSVGSLRNGGTVHIVSHVDIGGGGGLAGAPAMLTQLAEASRAEQGNVRFDALQHAMRANHFTIVESWANQAALDAHAAASHTRQYRDTLQPISGSPLDERAYVAVE